MSACWLESRRRGRVVKDWGCLKSSRMESYEVRLVRFAFSMAGASVLRSTASEWAWWRTTAISGSMSDDIRARKLFVWCDESCAIIFCCTLFMARSGGVPDEAVRGSCKIARRGRYMATGSTPGGSTELLLMGMLQPTVEEEIFTRARRVQRLERDEVTEIVQMAGDVDDIVFEAA